MNKRILWGAAAGIAVSASMALLLLRDVANDASVSTQTKEQQPSSVLPATQPLSVSPVHEFTAVTGNGQQPNLVATAEPSDASVSDEFGSDDLDKMFRADSAGNLRLSASARLNIEKLHALSTPDELQEKMQTLATLLPSAAHRQLSDLVDRYKNYTLATKQAYSPGHAPATVEDAIAQLDGMHSLRVAHFGAEVADAFFAEEEQLNRQLLELMRLDKDLSLTMEEKAAKAQQLIQSKPALAAAYHPERSTQN